MLKSTEEAASDQSPHVGPMSSAGILSTAGLPRAVHAATILRRLAANSLKRLQLICVQPLRRFLGPLREVPQSGQVAGVAAWPNSSVAYAEEGSRNLYANMGVEIALGGLDQKQAEEISQRGGNDTVQEVTHNRARFMGWLFPAKQSESEASRRRLLVLA